MSNLKSQEFKTSSYFNSVGAVANAMLRSGIVVLCCWFISERCYDLWILWQQRVDWYLCSHSSGITQLSFCVRKCLSDWSMFIDKNPWLAQISNVHLFLSVLVGTLIFDWPLSFNLYGDLSLWEIILLPMALVLGVFIAQSALLRWLKFHNGLSWQRLRNNWGIKRIVGILFLAIAFPVGILAIAYIWLAPAWGLVELATVENGIRVHRFFVGLMWLGLFLCIGGVLLQSINCLFDRYVLKKKG